MNCRICQPKYNKKDLFSLLNSINDAENKMNFVTGATSNSNVNMATMSRILRNYLSDNYDNDIVNEIALEYPWNNPINMRNSLKEKVLPIKQNLAHTLDGLWDSLLFKGRKEENRPPALLMREFISDFLHTLTLRKDLLDLAWCKKSNKGNPTQKSMVIFVILGTNEKFKWDNKVYMPIVELATAYRSLYQTLNGYTHYRGEHVSKDNRIKLKSYAEQLQNYTLEILKLKRISFYSKKLIKKALLLGIRAN